MAKKDLILGEADELLRKSISTDYVSDILDIVGNDVVADVNECADPNDWNEDDVRLAIGRVLLEKLIGHSV